MGRAVVRDDAFWSEEYNHRAAILEYDGGMSRKDAEREAGTWVALERLRVASERVQAKRRATVPVVVASRQTEQQATLPGFEQAYQGG